MGEVILFKKPKKDKHLLYKQALDNLCANLEGGTDLTNVDVAIVKMAYYAMQHINTMPERSTYQELYELNRIVFMARGALTIMRFKDLKQSFSIEKVYNGERLEVKDYFYSVKEFEDFSDDTRIGDKLDDVLWDYTNPIIRKFGINSYLIANRMERMRTGEGFTEKFFHDLGVDTYREKEDGTFERNLRVPNLTVIKND